MLARPYSLVNTPEEQYLEVYFNLVETGPLSPRLFDLQAGDDILVASNPSGFLTVSEVPPCNHLWMVATGTGIGPFLAILKSAPVWQKFERVVLCYSVSYAQELAYREVIEGIDRRHPGFRFRIVDEQDRLRPHIKLFIGQEMAETLDDPVTDTDVVTVTAALSGG